MSVPAQATTEEPTNTTMDELIDHMGEYFSEDEVHDFGLGYDYVKKSEISKKLAKAIKAAVDDRNEWLAPQGSVYDYEVYKIHDDENIVGYIIAIHDDIDHPLWDGSGVTVYLDLDFSVIDEVTWEG
jgi:molybdopterin converting factor small subunit